MFERFNEKTRRVIFFARYEASQCGSPSIETEHLLLGLLREAPEVVGGFLGPGDSIENVTRDVRDRLPSNERISTAIDLPLSSQCKTILKSTTEEAELLGHPYYDTIHLLLGVLREEGCMAAEILTGHGLDLGDIRAKLARGAVAVDTSAPPSPAQDGSSETSAPDYVPDAPTAMRIAEAVWIGMGFEDLERYRPFEARLAHPDFWSVGSTAPEGSPDGRLTAVISRRDGRILRADRVRD